MPLLILAVFWIWVGPAAADPIRVAVLGDPKVSPYAEAETETEHRIASLVWDGLTRFDQDGVPQPGLSAHWDVSDDGLVYRFQLKDGLRWSDGTPMLAEQFLAGVSELPLMSVAADPAGVITLTLTRPRADLLRILARSELGPRPPRPNLYSGPFQPADSGAPGLALEPNLMSHAPAGAALHLLPVVTYAEAQRLFERGEVHIAPAERAGFSARPGGQRLTAVTINYEAPDVGGVQGLDVRHALSMSVDREFLLEHLGLSGLTAQLTPLPPGFLLGGSYPIPFEGLSFSDRDGVAEALLAVADYTEEAPLELSVLVPDLDRLARTANWLAREWRALGVKVVLDAVSPQDFETRLARGQYQIALRDIPAYGSDAATLLAVYLEEAGTRNVARYPVAEFQSAYLQAEAANDPTVRRRRHRDSEKELIEDQIRISLYRSSAFWLISERVQGLPDKLAGPLPLERLWLVP